MAKGIDVNAWDEKGMPPIGLAALLGKPDIIVFLAAHGADVNRNDRFGFTPLMNAAIRGQPEAARILIALGADPTLKGGNGNDPAGAARPNGPSDRRYDGKIAVSKILEAAITAHSRASSLVPPQGQAAGAGKTPREQSVASGATMPFVGVGSIRFPIDQPDVSTEPHLQDFAKSVRENTKLSCDEPKFFRWHIAGWGPVRLEHNTVAVLEALQEQGYRMTELKAPFDNMRFVRVDNPAPARASTSLLLAFYREEAADYYLMACMANP